jgi:hypothetical protein
MLWHAFALSLFRSTVPLSLTILLSKAPFHDYHRLGHSYTAVQLTSNRIAGLDRTIVRPRADY